MQKGGLSEHDLDYIHEAFQPQVERRRAPDPRTWTKVISELTDYTSVAIGPHAEGERIRSLALLPCGDGRALRGHRHGRAHPARQLHRHPRKTCRTRIWKTPPASSPSCSRASASPRRRTSRSRVLAEFGQVPPGHARSHRRAQSVHPPAGRGPSSSPGRIKFSTIPSSRISKTSKTSSPSYPARTASPSWIGSDDDEIQINVKIGSCGDCDVPRRLFGRHGDLFGGRGRTSAPTASSAPSAWITPK